MIISAWESFIVSDYLVSVFIVKCVILRKLLLSWVFLPSSIVPFSLGDELILLLFLSVVLTTLLGMQKFHMNHFREIFIVSPLKLLASPRRCPLFHIASGGFLLFSASCLYLSLYSFNVSYMMELFLYPWSIFFTQSIKRPFHKIQRRIFTCSLTFIVFIFAFTSSSVFCFTLSKKSHYFNINTVFQRGWFYHNPQSMTDLVSNFFKLYFKYELEEKYSHFIVSLFNFADKVKLKHDLYKCN